MARGGRSGRGSSVGRGASGSQVVDAEAERSTLSRGGGRGVGAGRRGGSPQDGASSFAVQPIATQSLSTEGLRAFASPEWWLIGGERRQPEAATRRPRKQHSKPEVFAAVCAEKHAEFAKLYESAMMQDSEQRWLRKVGSDGTAGDKVASLTMLVQVCPVFATRPLKSLLNMASKMGRGDSMMAVDALKDLFVNTLLPDRKLQTLAQMEPMSAKEIGEMVFAERCVVAHFEDYLKTAFAAFVHVLSEAAQNTVTFFKTKALKTAAELIAAKPEQERALLGLMVNKFGDSASKVSSNVSLRLKGLLESHPRMKGVVVREVDAFLHRPNITQKSKYHALLFITELTLSKKDPKDCELAGTIVKLYVAQLEHAMKGASHTASAAGSSGQSEKSKVPKSKARRWRWFGGSKMHTASLKDDDNRVVRTLINGIQRALPYVDTSVGSPIQEDTVNALFSVCHTVSSFSTRIAILTLLNKHLFSHGQPPDRFYRLLYEQISQIDLFSSTHRLQAARLLGVALPADVLLNRGVALVRRLLQMGANSEAPVATVALTILRDMLQSNRTEIRQLIGSVDSKLRQLCGSIREDDDGEEAFIDDDVAVAAAAGDPAKAPHAEVRRYDPLKREPKYAMARQTPLWELFALANHVHPIVSHGAAHIISGEPFPDVSDDPFQEFSVVELMERFTYSTRVLKKTKFSSGNEKEGVKRIPYNSKKFLKRKKIAPHERFFWLYFTDKTVRKAQKRKELRKRQKLDDVDEEGDQDDEDDDAEEDKDKFFDGYLESQMPKGGDDDEGSEPDSQDVDVDDLDEDSDFNGDSDEPNDSGGGSESDEEQNETKRKKDDGSDEEEEANPRKRMKALRKKHAGSVFASAEDFEDMFALDE